MKKLTILNFITPDFDSPNQPDIVTATVFVLEDTKDNQYYSTVSLDELSRLMSEIVGDKYPSDTRMVSSTRTLERGAKAKALVKAFSMKPVKLFNSAYERVQHYGGPEEGGWYYHTLRYLGDAADHPEESYNAYGEGILHYRELYRKQHENLASQHYC